MGQDDERSTSVPPRTVSSQSWKKLVTWCGGVGAVLVVVLAIFNAGEKWQGVNRSIDENKRLLAQLKASVDKLTDGETGCNAKARGYANDVKDELEEAMRRDVNALILTNTAITQLRNEVRMNDREEAFVSSFHTSLMAPPIKAGGAGGAAFRPRAPTKRELVKMEQITRDNADQAIEEAFKAAIPSISADKGAEPVKANL